MDLHCLHIVIADPGRQVGPEEINPVMEKSEDPCSNIHYSVTVNNAAICLSLLPWLAVLDYFAKRMDRQTPDEHYKQS